jgi:hypothetical protein
MLLEIVTLLHQCRKAPCGQNIEKIGEIWKDLHQTKKMLPTATFSNHPFRIGNQFKKKVKRCEILYLNFVTLFF